MLLEYNELGRGTYTLIALCCTKLDLYEELHISLSMLVSEQCVRAFFKPFLLAVMIANDYER